MPNKTIKPGELDSIKNSHEFDYFTIGRGKAQYHMFHLPDNSCGIYYALRVMPDGFLGCRRAVEPTQDIVAHYK